MKIAIYQPYLKERGGMEKVVLEYAKNSEHKIEILTMNYDREGTFDEFEEAEVREIGNYGSPGSFLEQAINFGIRPLFRKVGLEDYDVLVVSEAGFGSPITVRNDELPIIAYVHTPLRAALPKFRQRYRQEFALPLRPFFPMFILGYNILERLGWSNFEKVIANSELTKNRMDSKGLRRKEEVEVINPGVEVEGKSSSNYEKYFFYPSRFEPYKRQEMAIEAFKQAELEDFELVLAGASADENYVEELRVMAGENVRIEVDVPGDKWEELYSDSYSVLFCAEKEDWGIIPLEAGSFGKPVVAVDEGSTSETVEDNETGFLVEANASEIAEKMERLAKNPEQVREIGEKGREHSQEYSWEKFAARLDEEIEDMK
ncbi:MAG: glycosyltransferase family 4 protein [Candidatus Nanohaloarchaea archaeon]